MKVRFTPMAGHERSESRPAGFIPGIYWTEVRWHPETVWTLCIRRIKRHEYNQQEIQPRSKSESILCVAAFEDKLQVQVSAQNGSEDAEIRQS
jgi:hypothetical protein